MPSLMLRSIDSFSLSQNSEDQMSRTWSGHVSTWAPSIASSTDMHAERVAEAH